MNPTEFDEAGSIEKPGPIGRWVRILSGLLCFYFLSTTIRGYDGIVSDTFPAVVSLWFGVLFWLEKNPDYKSLKHLPIGDFLAKVMAGEK